MNNQNRTVICFFAMVGSFGRQWRGRWHWKGASQYHCCKICSRKTARDKMLRCHGTCKLSNIPWWFHVNQIPSQNNAIPSLQVPYKRIFYIACVRWKQMRQCLDYKADGGTMPCLTSKIINLRQSHCRRSTPGPLSTPWPWSWVREGIWCHFLWWRCLPGRHWNVRNPW